MDFLVHKAIRFAANAHRHQLRKATDIPYITHPFEVALLLQKENAAKQLVAAALLHDTVEDTEVTLEDIVQNFGEKVARLVAANSEDKSKSWKDRKQHTIDQMNICQDREILLLVCADKTANLNSIAYDFKSLGTDLWRRFNASYENIKWYHLQLLQSFEPIKDLDIYNTYKELCQEIFKS